MEKFMETTFSNRPPTPLTPFERAVRQLNHVSGCGLETIVLRDRIFNYIWGHGDPEGWHSLHDIFSDQEVAGYIQFGKRVIDPLVLLMVGAGQIEVDSLPNPRMMRRL
jgi:hypothetical protein